MPGIIKVLKSTANAKNALRKGHNMALRKTAQNPTRRPQFSGGGGGGFAVYDGYFQIENVKKDPDNPDDVAKITVHHGKNGDSFLTAKMQINQSIIDLPTKENLATQAGYLYLAATADSYNHVTLEYLLDNNINFEEDKVKILIGKFTSQDDKFIFQRCYYGGFAQFLTLGDCSK